MATTFEWDDLKNEQNKEKHGVSFLDAQYAFADPRRLIIQDLDHSANEERYFCLGEVKRRRHDRTLYRKGRRDPDHRGRLLEKREEDL